MPTDWGSISGENARRASRNHEISRGMQGGSGCLTSLAITVGAALVVAVAVRVGWGQPRRVL